MVDFSSSDTDVPPMPNEGPLWAFENSLDTTEPLIPLRFRRSRLSIGRSSTCQVLLVSAAVSNFHAELFLMDGAVWLRDLESTNGTWVNSRLVTSAVQLVEGDLVQFGDLEYRLSSILVQASRPTLDATQLFGSDEMATKARGFRDFLERREVLAHFQPIVSAQTDCVVGEEMLCRAVISGQLSFPHELFGWAERMGEAVRLSEACRLVGLNTFRSCRLAGPAEIVFLNSHPAELEDKKRFLASLEALAERAGGQRVVVELHEGAEVEIAFLATLQRHLDGLGMGLAFDDFGKGTSRLLAISEVAPEYVKFDRALLSELVASSKKRRLVGELVASVKGLGCLAVAEGIESEASAQACKDLGFDLLQGYFFGRPRLLMDLQSGGLAGRSKEGSCDRWASSPSAESGLAG